MGFVTPRFTEITSSKRRRVKGDHAVIEVILTVHMSYIPREWESTEYTI